MGAGASVLRGPGEVAEDEATGETARAYARLRDALGAAFVPTVFRMLGRHGPYLAAGVDAVLERADAPALERLAADGRAVGAAAAARLPGPALDAGREAPAVAALLERYNTVNPRGIAFVLALRGDTPRPPAPVLRAPLPPPVPGLLDDVRACHAGLTVPGLWRELAAGHPAVAGQAVGAGAAAGRRPRAGGGPRRGDRRRAAPGRRRGRPRSRGTGLRRGGPARDRGDPGLVRRRDPDDGRRHRGPACAPRRRGRTVVTMTAPWTVAQKILATHGVEDLTPGAFGLARVDLVMTNDVSGSVALREFEKIGAQRVFDPSRVALFADHFAPAKDVRSAQLVGRLRRFAREQGIEQYWEAGSTPNGGIEHTVLAEEGLIAPGDFIPGGDSHSCTYGAFGAFGTGVGSTDIAAALALGELWVRVPQTIRVEYRGTAGPQVTGKDLILAYLAQSGVAGGTYAALEFAGPPIDATSIDERMALCNMAVEAGAKTGIVPADATTLAWLADKVTDRPLVPVLPDEGASYAGRAQIDLDGMRPLVAARPRRPTSCRSTPSTACTSTRSTSATAPTAR